MEGAPPGTPERTHAARNRGCLRPVTAPLAAPHAALPHAHAAIKTAVGPRAMSPVPTCAACAPAHQSMESAWHCRNRHGHECHAVAMKSPSTRQCHHTVVPCPSLIPSLIDYIYYCIL